MFCCGSRSEPGKGLGCTSVSWDVTLFVYCSLLTVSKRKCLHKETSAFGAMATCICSYASPPENVPTYG